MQLRFLAVTALNWLRNKRLQYRVFSKFRFALREGSVIDDVRFVSIGKDFHLGRYCAIYCQDPAKGSRITFGNRIFINEGVMINADCGGTITFGNNILIGPHVVIRASNHKFKDAARLILDQGHEAGEIHIEDDVWIGASAVILPGVRLKQGTVVAAGAVVTKDSEPYQVVAGVPARHISQRTLAQ